MGNGFRKSLLITLFVFIFLPAFADTKTISWPLKENEAENFLDISRKEALSRTNSELFFQAIYYSNKNFARDTGAVVLIKQAILAKQLNYWFFRMPKELSQKFLKAAFEIIKIVSIQDISGIIEIIEKFTAQKASEYAINWLLQNETKIGTGKADYSFYSHKGVWKEFETQYIIVFQPKNNNSGNIVIEFYSRNPIEPPLGKGGIGALGGEVDWINSTTWPFEIWLENEKKGNNDGKLEPFIVRIKGDVRKNEAGLFVWDKSKDEPVVEIDFNKPIPKIEESDIILEKEKFEMELEFLKEKILKPILRETISIKNFLSSGFESIKNKLSGALGKIKSYFSSQNFGAQILQGNLVETAIKESLKEVSKEQAAPENKKDFEDLVEIFDEIYEQADLTINKAEKFLAENCFTTNDFKEENDDNEENSNEDEESNFSDQSDEPYEPIILCPILTSGYPQKNKIIFNEIAWMGTINSANDEWMELKNISGSLINVGDWQILDKDGQIKTILKPQTVYPEDFYLLERTDDDSVSNIAADTIYLGGLNNEKEIIYLFDENCILQDVAEANPDWPAGLSESKKTMERKSDLSWQTSKYAGGTPKAQNSSGETALASTSSGSNGSNSGSENNVGGGSSPSTYQPALKILITEVQTKNASSSENDFIELFNPNANDMDISGFQLKKKSSTGNEYSIRVLPNGSKIRTLDYFIWANSDYASSGGIAADATSGQTISNNNSIAFFDNNDFILDSVAWGSSTNPFVETSAFSQNPGENQSLGRKFSNSAYIDIDNNLLDFELQFPTPKQKNQITEPQSPTSTPTLSPTLAQNVVISEIQTNENEFIELYNPTDSTINISSWYFSYFSKDREWNDPWRNKQFPTSSMPAKTHFLIGLYNFPENSGNPNSDWQPYSSDQLSNSEGAIGIFSCNPSLASTSEEAESYKIDAFGWNEPMVKEGNATSGPEKDKSMNRKKDSAGNFIDENDNSTDFEEKSPTPTNSKGETNNMEPPEKIQDFICLNDSIQDSISLRWSTTTDPDTENEFISYIIYWLTSSEIDENNITTADSTTTGATTTSFELTDIFYDTYYHFAIRAFDGLNYSEITTSSCATSLVTVADLNVGPSADRKSLDIFWSSPGIDVTYLIKLSEKPIIESGAGPEQIEWDDATPLLNSLSSKNLGEIEEFSLIDFNPSIKYYFAIKSENTKGAVSAISNIASGQPTAGFQDNSDGTITDLQTGLVWIKDGASETANNGASLDWQSAKSFVDSLDFAGQTDWRLPNYKELQSIIQYSKNSPLIDENYFLNISIIPYWTTSYKYTPPIAFVSPEKYEIWTIDFSSGQTKTTFNATNLYNILPVRGPNSSDILPVTNLLGDSSGCSSGLQDNGDETITDLCTNLIWTKEPLSGIGYFDSASGVESGVTWENAVKIAASSTFAGYDDWRLPNISELAAFGRLNDVVGKNFEWSSTADFNDPPNKFAANLKNYPGITVSSPITMEYYLRLVRNIN